MHRLSWIVALVGLLLPCDVFAQDKPQSSQCLAVAQSLPNVSFVSLRNVAAEKGEVLTGLLYLAADAEDLHAHLNTYQMAFNKLGERELCPGSAMLEKINSGLR